MNRACILRVEMTSESLTVDGELDINTAPLLAAAHDAPLVDIFEPLVRVDARGVKFCDVAGLRAVRNLTDSLQESGHRVWLLTSASMERLFALTGLSPVPTDNEQTQHASTAARYRPASDHPGSVTDQMSDHATG